MIYSKINKLLTENNISVSQLAEKIGMSKRGLYSTFENKTLSVKTLEKIAEVFDVPITSFFEDENDKLDKQALIAEVKRLDKKIEELVKRNDEYLDIIGDKRLILRFIYIFIQNMQEDINEIEIKNINIKSILNKLSQALKMTEEGINVSEKFDIEDNRMKEINEARSKNKEDTTKEIISQEDIDRFKSIGGKAYSGLNDDPKNEQDTIYIGHPFYPSKDRSKFTVILNKGKETKKSKD